MLDFEDRLGGVLHAERNVRKRVLVERAVDRFQLAQRFERRVPLFVPHRHLGGEHPPDGRTHTVVGDLRRTHLVEVGNDLHQLFDQVAARFNGRHARQAGRLVEQFLGVDVDRVEGHVAEDRREQVVIHRPQDHALGQQLAAVVLAHRGVADAFDGGVAVHHGLVALGPHRGPVAGQRGRDFETRIVYRRRIVVQQVGDPFGHHAEIEIIDRLERNVAAVQPGDALRLVAVEIAPVDEKLGRFLKRAGACKRCRDRQQNYFHRFHNRSRF